MNMKDLDFKYLKLGTFVLSGLVILVGFLYLIGKNKNFFGSNYILKSRFSNVQGLKTGNNVRFGGIEIGTVTGMEFINDTSIEIEMNVEEKMKSIIRKNALVTIGTDGLVGNKLVNITPTGSTAAFAKENEILNSRKPLDSEDLLLTLENTGKDLNEMVTNLKITSLEIRKSKMLKDILNDETLAKNLRKSSEYVSSFSSTLDQSAKKINKMISEMENGKGLLGKIYKDSNWTNATDAFMLNLETSSNDLTKTAQELNAFVVELREETMNGNGLLHDMFKNREWSSRVDSILIHTKQGSNNINQLALALQKHFLFRKYFKKTVQEKK